MREADQPLRPAAMTTACSGELRRAGPGERPPMALSTAYSRTRSMVSSTKKSATTSRVHHEGHAR